MVLPPLGRDCTRLSWKIRSTTAAQCWQRHLGVQRVGNRTIASEKRRMRRGKRVLLYRLPNGLDLACQKAQVVDRGQAQSENLARAEQMMEIGGAEPGTGLAVTLRVNRRVNLGEPALLDIDTSRRRKQSSVAGQSCRQYAIEEIDPPRDTHPQ